MRNEKGMDKRPLVVLLSDSILMEGLGESLQEELGLNVVQMESHRQGLQERLDALAPDLIVTDLDNPQLANILTMLKKQPETQYLAIDQQLSQVVVLNCNRYPIHSMNEFCQLAETLLDGNDHKREGEETLNIHSNNPPLNSNEALNVQSSPALADRSHLNKGQG